VSTVSVIIATYGEDEWEKLALERAEPSVGENHGPGEVVTWHESDGTRASSLNRGAKVAEGDWLIFLDADDELAPGYVGAMRRALEQTGDGPVLFTPAVQQIRKGRPGQPFFFPECDFRTGNWLVIGTMISKALFMEIGGFHDHPHGLEDWNLWARAVRAGATVVRVKDAVYRAHVNPKSKHHVLTRDRPEYMRAYEVARQDAWG
jgi:glycosyltransferase involved in cell wall biosynthesis